MSSPDGVPARFSTVTGVRPTGDGGFAADLHPAWTIGGKPNGGYLLAILARSAVAASGAASGSASGAATGSATESHPVAHPHVLAASAHFLTAPEPGPVTVAADVLRTGRSATQVRTRLSQRNVPCVEAIVTTTRLDPAAEPYWDAAVPSPGGGLGPSASPDDIEALMSGAVRVPGHSPTGVRVAIMDEVDLRIDRETAQFAAGRPTGRGELRGWLTLPDGEPFDPTALLYAVDAFPPATFDIEATGWVPTLELTCYVRALPAPGPVRVLHRAQLIDGGRVDEQTWVFDVRGRLVATATQLAGIRLG